MKMKKANSLAVKAPHLVDEFHPSKNSITPDQITYSSNKKVWWKCLLSGHEWEATVGNRYRGSGCPGCSGRRLSGENNLAVKCPHLIAQWHPTKNGSLSPWDVAPRGKTKVWWQCENGHEWRATAGNRYMGTGCPHCDGRRVTPENNLAIKYPLLVLQWHYEKNCNLSPDQVMPGSSRKVWWKCESGHEWRASIQARVRGQKCPFCIGKRASLENNFAVKCPHLLSEWHYEKNQLSPHDVTYGSKKVVWWKCKFEHVWKAAIYTRAAGHGCPKCNFRSSRLEVRIYCELKYIFRDTLWQAKIQKREVDVFIPSHSVAIEVDGWYWHRTSDRLDADNQKSMLLKSNGIKLIRVMDNRMERSKKTTCLLYKNGEHERDVVVRLLNLFVTELNLSSDEKININSYLHSNQYANEDKYNEIMTQLPAPQVEDSVLKNDYLVSEWSYDKNVLPPSYYSCGSKAKVWWKCLLSGHEWMATIGSRAAGRGCPYCKKKKASPEYNLLVCSPELAREFHPVKNKPLTADMVLPRSNKKVWWVCKKRHEWMASIDNRFNGAGCPDCIGKRLSKNHNLAVKLPELISQWHVEKNFPLTPYDVTPKNNTKFWWICEKGHEWLTSPEKRTRGRGCHVCSGYVR